MHEDGAAGADAGPQVVVAITPRDYRRRALVATLGGLVVIAVGLLPVVQGESFGNPFVGVAAVGYGLYCRRQARQQVTSTILRVDRSGIRSGEGLYDQSWAGVVMVWVGSSTGLRLPVVGQPVLSVFTGAGVEFAARAGTRPMARYSVPVGPPWTVKRLCTELRTITSAAVVDGRRTSRSAAARELRQAGPG